ncbi:MAG: DUF3782 domain-containing protein [Spirochaetaceae bacterium]|nr:DUF3782 domain-containing protein [Spirochaetaceae bacterium]
MIAELQANPEAQRLMLRALLTNEFLGMPARLDRIERDVAELKADVKGLNARVTSVEDRLTSLENKMDAGFDEMRRAIDRLGARWGVRNESLFRQTMASVLQESFGVTVEQRTIAGEQFDLLIFDGQHVLVEIAASVGPSIAQRLQRKRRLYQEETGVEPERVILATASIHSRRAQELREMGIEVVEPEDAD